VIQSYGNEIVAGKIQGISGIRAQMGPKSLGVWSPGLVLNPRKICAHQSERCFKRGQQRSRFNRKLGMAVAIKLLDEGLLARDVSLSLPDMSPGH
jgi:hypothetical protein